MSRKLVKGIIASAVACVVSTASSTAAPSPLAVRAAPPADATAGVTSAQIVLPAYPGSGDTLRWTPPEPLDDDVHREPPRALASYAAEARRFLAEYLKARSTVHPATLEPIVKHYYAPSVTLNGRARSRDDVARLFVADGRRWPIQTIEQDGGAAVDCEPRGRSCDVAVVVRRTAADLSDGAFAGDRAVLRLHLTRQRGRYAIARETLSGPGGNRVLRTGSEPIARDVQAELDRHGCRPGAVDGVWGPRSQAALERFVAVARVPTMGAAPNLNTLGILRRVPSPRCR